MIIIYELFLFSIFVLFITISTILIGTLLESAGYKNAYSLQRIVKFIKKRLKKK